MAAKSNASEYFSLLIFLNLKFVNNFKKVQKIRMGYFKCTLQ